MLWKGMGASFGKEGRGGCLSGRVDVVSSVLFVFPHWRLKFQSTGRAPHASVRLSFAPVQGAFGKKILASPTTPITMPYC